MKKPCAGRWMCLASALLLSGCISTGLSPRETGSQSYAGMVYGLYSDGAAARGRKNIDAPIRLAVGQIGEVAPADSMVNALLERRELVSEIIPIPVLFGGGVGDSPSRDIPTGAVLSTKLTAIRNMALDAGADYVFLFGGSLDSVVIDSPWSVLNVTIVGYWLVPASRIESEGKAAGALIDAHDGRVVALVSSSAERHARSAGFYAADRQRESHMKLRDELLDKLASRLSEKLVQR